MAAARHETAIFESARSALLRERRGQFHVASPTLRVFFDDNTLVLRRRDPIGERLTKLAAEQSMLLMLCDGCALHRGRAEGETWPGTATTGTVDNVAVGCCPTSTKRSRAPDHVASL